MRFASILFLFVGTSILAAADPWVRGALTVHEVDGAVSMARLGDERVQIAEARPPLALGGMVDFQGDNGASVFVSTSTRAYFYFVGEGSFAVERFEQERPDETLWMQSDGETGQSRTIINFRAGVLFGDNRGMAELSQCLIETPVGRLTLREAFWYMSINYDPRSRIFDFMVHCREGRVRFSDLNGNQYTLRAGQRLAGAGARLAPSIEVGETTDLNRELMSEFAAKIDSLDSVSTGLAQYQKQFEELDDPGGINLIEEARWAPSFRPIVIDYASDPDLVTPFRGELRPLTDSEKDIF